jgi:hypothetical protein
MIGFHSARIRLWDRGNIQVPLGSTDYGEDVHVWLLRSVPGGFDTVDLKTLTIPVGTTVAVRFAYKFTSSDASLVLDDNCDAVRHL